MNDQKQNLPSVYIYGMPINRIDDTIYGGLFGNATRSVGLAFNLAKNGHKVFLEVANDFHLEQKSLKLPENLSITLEKNRKEVASEADAMLISCTNIQSINDLFGRNAYIKHPNKVIASCFDLGQSISLNLLQKNTKLITFNNKQQKIMWDSRCSLIPSVVIPYGVNEKSEVEEAIQEVEVPSALWMGAIRRPDMLKRIVQFSRVNFDCNVSVVTRTIIDSSITGNNRGGRDNPYADFRGRDKFDVFYDIVEEFCQIKTPSNITFLGPMEGMNHIIQGKHTIGLDFSRFPSQSHDNTKILDYLRSGLCVICDKGTPSYRYVEETGHGVVVSPDFDDDEIREAFKKCRRMATIERRKEVSRYIAKKYGWDTLSEKFSELICSSLKQKSPSVLRRTNNQIYRASLKVKRALTRGLNRL